MSLLNDVPTLDDQLDRTWLVREVSDAVATCDPPQVFGIHGDWGLGKTSFLHQLQRDLTGECPALGVEQPDDAGQDDAGRHGDHVRAVWFEAWRYQHESAPVVALLQEIRAQLDWQTKLRGSAAKLLEVSIRGSLMALEDITKKIGIQASKLQRAGEQWERDHLATALPSHTIRGFLAEAIGNLLPEPAEGQPKPRLVVLIDDLDRCEGEAAFRLLEGLKIYLTLRNCVFVLGMNQQVIEDAIGQSVPQPADGASRTRRATAYLEKLCQNVWHLPMVAAPDRLLLGWLRDDEPAERGLRQALDRVLTGASWQCLPPNPRRLKGLANLLRRMAPVFAHRCDYLASLTDGELVDADASDEATRLLIVAYIYQFHSELYRRWEASPDLFLRLRDWVSRSSSLDEPAPLFADLDLPRRVTIDESTPTPRHSFQNAFPDPAEGGTFWIQPLLIELDASVGPEDFLPYLRAGSAGHRGAR